jgi:hypothetical protein
MNAALPLSALPRIEAAKKVRKLAFRPSALARNGLFRTFGAVHGAGPEYAGAGEYAKTRARSSGKPARPYI